MPGSIREDYLHQNAFDDVDTYTSPEKQFQMLNLILLFDQHARAAPQNGADIEALLSLPVREEIGRAKYIPEDQVLRDLRLFVPISWNRRPLWAWKGA